MEIMMNKRIKKLISIGVLSVTILIPATSYANNPEEIKEKSSSTTISVSSSTEIKAITAGSTMSATWGQSATASVTTTHTVPKGKVGAVYLKPYKYNLKANLTTMHSSGATTTKSVTSISPKKILKNFCDGLEYLSTRNI